MKTKKKSKKKGFTLIELLVVIAIIAILSVVVVLTLNPAEMLRRSRDSNRASDLSIVKTALSLYLADVSSTSMGTPGACYIAFSGATAPVPGNVYEFQASTTETGGQLTPFVATLANGVACGQWANTSATTVVSSTRSVNTIYGWIPINLSLISSGAPIGQWPVDPAYSAGSPCTTNGTCNASAARFYSYISTSTNNGYKITAKMESALYSQGGTGDLESTDGGIDPNIYEQGTNLTGL